MRENFCSGTKELIVNQLSSLNRLRLQAKAFKLGLLIALTIATTFSSRVQCQSGSRPDRGTVTNVPYDASSVENINLQNGNVGLAIPLASLPPMAGGKLSFTLKAYYNSKLWDTYSEQRVVRPPEDNGSGELHATGYLVEIPRLSDQGGWRIGGIYRIQCVGVSNFYVRAANNNLDPTPDDQVLFGQPWAKCFLVSPDGAEHEIRPLNKSPYNGNNPFFFDFFKDSPTSTNQAMPYYTIDGSFISLTWYPPSNSMDFEAHLPDGTKVQNQKDGIQRIIDPNGNSIKIFGDAEGAHFQDELTGREIRSVEYEDRIEVWYKTVTGTSEKVELKKGTTTIYGKFYTVQIPDLWGSQSPGPCTFQEEFGGGPVSVIREIIFPQTESGHDAPKYTFSYNSDQTDPNGAAYTAQCNSPATYPNPSVGLGELSKMITPTGAVHKYSYAMDFAHITSDASFSDRSAATNFITTKTVEHDGGSPEVWTYGSSAAVGIGGVGNPDGSTITLTAYNHFAGNPSTAGGTNGLGGLVYRENRSNQVVIERRWNRLVFSGASEVSGGGKATFNPVVTEEFITLLDSNGVPQKMAASKYSYDYNGNLLQKTDYDWFDNISQIQRDAVGVPIMPSNPPILRVTTNTYHNSPSGPTATEVYAKTNNTLLNVLKETVVGNSDTKYFYDNQLFDTAPTHGNTTKISVWDSQYNEWRDSLFGFDSFGNLTSKTDPSGNVTTLIYGDSTHSQPTSKIVNPGSEVQTAQTSQVSYDFDTGLPLTTTDVNGNVSSISYTNHLLGAVDPYGRPGTNSGPIVSVDEENKRQTVKTYYEDSARRTRVETDLFNEGDQLSKTRSTRDQLGRVVLYEVNENGSSDYKISAQTIYKVADRVLLVSNRARANASATDGWTRTTSDLLGRTTEIATFAGAAPPPVIGTNANWTGSITTVYEANATTVTDQSGRKRRSLINGVGQLIRIDEPDSSGQLGDVNSPNQPTTYAYDVLGNLTEVHQNGTNAAQCGGGVVTSCPQSRLFQYSSMSHLMSATNPESGTTTYDYFPNGSLKKKTDARGVATSYEYDGLDRVKTRTYSDSTPSVTFSYDSGSFGKGRLISATSTVSTYTYTGYDALGRITGATQTIGGQTYTLTFKYDLGGRIKSITYPSGNKVDYGYDTSARLQSFSGSLGGGSTTVYSTGDKYDASGRLRTEQFGTDTPIYNKIWYNSRGQLSEIRVSTSLENDNDDTWNRGRIINDYTLQCSGIDCKGTDNNGNLRRQKIDVPDDDLNAHPTSWYQQFEYDSLNRLTQVKEFNAQANPLFQQAYRYDRFGNRRIDVDGTSLGLNRKDFEVELGTNRLLAPGDLALTDVNQRKMRYDNAGNLINDSWSSVGSSTPGAASRTYDGENRMTSALDTPGGTTHYYYDAYGRRVRRAISNQPEVWQVYGLNGELLAEYPVNGSPSAPSIEYGYRNAQLLITAGAPTLTQPQPGSLSASPYNGGPSVSLTWTSSAGAVNYRIERATSKNGPYGLAGASTSTSFIDNGVTSGTAYLYRVCAATSGNTCTSPYSNIVLGTAVSFVTDPTIKSYSEDPVNATTPKANHILELRTAVNAVRSLAGKPAAAWTNTTLVTGSLISAADVRDLRTNLDEALQALGIPTSAYTDSALKGYLEDPINATPIKADHIRELRQRVSGGIGGPGGTPAGSALHWLVSDQAGSTRMIFDKSGSLQGSARRDYLPFGEALTSEGLRGGLATYSLPGQVRQQFSSKERDAEIGLDYFLARYYSSIQGRFTSVDPENAGSIITNPQSLNGYSYVLNSPVILTDPNGLGVQVCVNGACHTYTESEFARYKKEAQKCDFVFKNGKIYYNDSGDPNSPNYVEYGTYISDMNDLAVGVSKELERRNDSFQTFGQVTMQAEIFLITGLTTIGPVGTDSIADPNIITRGHLTGSLEGRTLAERQYVEELLTEGKNVEVLKESTLEGVKTADFNIDGVVTELKTIETLGNNTIKNAIEAAAKQGQQIVIDARGLNITPQQAGREILRAQGNIGGLSGRVTVLTNGGRVTF